MYVCPSTCILTENGEISSESGLKVKYKLDAPIRYIKDTLSTFRNEERQNVNTIF